MHRFTKFAKGRTARRVAGQMNGTEKKYAEVLEGRQRDGEIVWYAFERLTWKLADDTRYTPDFLVMMADGSMECHEVKGFWRDDAKVKIKVAADLFPFKFLSVSPRSKKAGGGWEVTEF